MIAREYSISASNYIQPVGGNQWKMEKSKNKAVIVIHAIYTLVAAVISILFFGLDGQILMGLAAGFAVAVVNYVLLALTVGRLLGRANFLAVQLFLFRYLLYLIAAYICMRTGNTAVIMYGVGIIGLSLAIFITYGIGGMKDQ